MFRPFLVSLVSAAVVFVFGGFAMIVSMPQADAHYTGRGGRTAVWLYIRKHPDEDIWEACRRVYGRDVYSVRGAGPRKARCLVDASEVSNPQGFNSSRELD